VNKEIAFIILPPSIWPVLDYVFEIGLDFCERNPNVELYIVSVDRTLRFNPSRSKFDLVSYLEAEYKKSKLKRFFSSKSSKYFELKKLLKSNFTLNKDIQDKAMGCAINTVQAHFKDTTIDAFGSKKNYIDEAFLDFIDGYKFILNFLKSKNNIKSIFIYNGRMSIYRGILESCLDNNIDFSCYEYPFQGKKRYLLTKNRPIHDFSYRSKRLMDVALNHPLKLDKKISLGNKWLERRNKSRMGFELNFASQQTNNQIPHELLYLKKSGKKFILLLNSSEWEWSGFEQSRTNIFGSQKIAIEWLLDDFLKKNEDYFLIFRFHPQFSFRDTKYKEILNNMVEDKNSGNVFVIQPNSKMNTQTLISFTDIVLTFYSSTAPEASYQGKKVISIGPSSFQDFECCQMAYSKKGLEKMLLEESSLSQKIINKRKNMAALFFFARSFQGYKSKNLRYDKYDNPFIIFRKKKIYIYSPLVINFSFKFFRALLIVFKNPKKFSLKKLRKMFYLNSFNF
tara:strand:+ start:1453 stop:2979 length:1527 start_codon:yes stop_codon:yes gene_type:complete